MASLGSVLSIAVQSLQAANGGLQATNNNISNANTPGYTREVAVLQEASPITEGNLTAGNGVLLEGYQSIRDELVQGQIRQQTSDQSGANAELASLQQIQTAFTASTSDIGTEMSSLFSSLSSLATNPTSSSSRQAVLTAGQNLATAFNTASNAMTSQQTGLNTQVTQDVSQINQLAQEIAALNPKIAEQNANSPVSDGGTLQDQQDQLVTQLAALTNVSVTQTGDGETITTGNGTPLVVGTQSFALQTATSSTGAEEVLDSNGNDISSTLTSGDLGGTLQTLNTTIPGLLNQLDTLANQFATAFNSAQASGYDQNGKAGQDFYSIPNTVAGSAGTITMAISDPALIAASSDGTSGSDGNLTSFTAVKTNALPSGQTPTDAYASLVYQVGSLTSNANAESSATTASLTQLKDQFNSVSGVSIDQESANLITYQNAYEAAARVISTIQALFTTTMSMVTS